jgi:hypothetical protein
MPYRTLYFRRDDGSRINRYFIFDTVAELLTETMIIGDWGYTVDTKDFYIADTPTTWQLISGASGNPSVDAQYITLSLDATLTNERVLTAGTNITLVDGGPGSTLTISAANTSPASPDTSVQFNDGGVFGGDAELLWLKTANILSIGGDINFQYTSDSAGRTIIADPATGDGDGVNVNLWAGDGAGTGVGGDINIFSGYSGSGGDGGDISIVASDGGNIRIFNDDGGVIFIGVLNTDKIYYTTVDTVGTGGADHYFSAGSATSSGFGGSFYFTTGSGAGSNKGAGGFYFDFGNPTGSGNQRFFDFSPSGGLSAEKPAVKFCCISGNWVVGSGNTITNQRFFQFLAPTINGVAGGGTETITNCATLYIDGAPSGSNITITNPYSFWVDAGASRFDGNLDFSTADATNIILGSSTGTKIGTATTQKLGFFNKTPVVQPSAYTPSNVTTDRSYDANSTSVDEIADVLGTLIADLQSLGLIG